MCTRAAGVLLTLGLLSAISLPAAAQRAPSRSGSTDLPADVLALACAPRTTAEEPPMPLRVTGGQDSFVRYIYVPGDLVTINAGTDNGIEVGQEYFVRRVVQVAPFSRPSRAVPANIHTAGWIRVWAVDDQMSLATVTHACDTIDVGDYLEPFVLPAVPVPAADRPKPQRENYGRVMIGADRRQTFGNNDFIIVDRGSDHGVMPGSHFVIFRDKGQDQNFLYELGEAVAVHVQPETATIRVTMARDGISTGDYVALRR